MASDEHAVSSPRPLRRSYVVAFWQGLGQMQRVHAATQAVRTVRIGLLLSGALWLSLGTDAEFGACVIATAALGGMWELFAPRLLLHAFRAVPHRRSMLATLLPSHATRVVGAECDERVLLRDVRPGDVLRVRPREPIPVDGVILEGRSAVDELRLTGEPLPIDKRAGSHLYGGTRNGRGLLLMRAERSCTEGVLADILDMLDEAAHSEASAVRAAGAIELRFQAGSTLLAGVVWLSALLASTAESGAARGVAALALTLACGPPVLARCAELATARATSRGAFSGVLLRSADVLMRLARCTCLVVDKTETVTEPRARVVSIVAGDGDEPRLISDAAWLCQGLGHPLATAIHQRAHTLGLSLAPAPERNVYPGEGCCTRDVASRLALGSQLLLRRLGVQDVTLEAKAEALREHGQSVLFVVRAGEVAGLVGLSVPIKLTTREALRELDDLGIRTVLASGDGHRTLACLAEELGLAEVRGDLNGEGKRTFVAELRARGHVVALAVRDASEAPAVEAADVAIALGAETPLGRSCAVQVFPTDLAALARALGFAAELTRALGRMRLVGALHRLVFPLLLLSIQRYLGRFGLPVLGLLWSVGTALLLALAALDVGRERRDSRDWVTRA
jgi:Cu+-exporting ATPase